MKEALVILIVVVAILALTAYRYRRQITTAVHIWRMLKTARHSVREREESISDRNATNSGILVNCTKCGHWVPEDEALRLGRLHYCSTKCVETATKTR